LTGLQDLPRTFNGGKFQMAAANGACAELGKYQHVRAGLSGY
jgi:hypothetical protein